MPFFKKQEKPSAAKNDDKISKLSLDVLNLRLELDNLREDLDTRISAVEQEICEKD